MDRPMDRMMDRPPMDRLPMDRMMDHRPMDRMDRMMERSMDRPPMVRPMDRPMDRALDRPMDRPIERQMDRPMDRPMGRQMGRSTSPPPAPPIPPDSSSAPMRRSVNGRDTEDYNGNSERSIDHFHHSRSDGVRSDGEHMRYLVRIARPFLCVSLTVLAETGRADGSRGSWPNHHSRENALRVSPPAPASQTEQRASDIALRSSAPMPAETVGSPRTAASSRGAETNKSPVAGGVDTVGAPREAPLEPLLEALSLPPEPPRPLHLPEPPRPGKVGADRPKLGWGKGLGTPTTTDDDARAQRLSWGMGLGKRTGSSNSIDDRPSEEKSQERGEDSLEQPLGAPSREPHAPQLPVHRPSTAPAPWASASTKTSESAGGSAAMARSGGAGSPRAGLAPDKGRQLSPSKAEAKEKTKKGDKRRIDESDKGEKPKKDKGSEVDEEAEFGLMDSDEEPVVTSPRPGSDKASKKRKQEPLPRDVPKAVKSIADEQLPKPATASIPTPVKKVSLPPAPPAKPPIKQTGPAPSASKNRGATAAAKPPEAKPQASPPPPRSSANKKAKGETSRVDQAKGRPDQAPKQHKHATGSVPAAAPRRSQPDAPPPFVPTPAMVIAREVAASAKSMPSRSLALDEVPLTLVEAVLRENALRSAAARKRVDDLDELWLNRSDVEKLAGGNVSNGLSAPLYMRPSEAPGWAEREAAWRSGRSALMKVVRGRRLELRRHVAALASKYDENRKTWEIKVERIERERAAERGDTVSLLAAAAASSRRSSYRDRGASILGGDGIIRSDYEQEMVRFYPHHPRISSVSPKAGASQY